MSVVFILGAGASRGESLAVFDRIPPPPAKPTAPPVTNGFFKQEMFDSIGYPGATAEKDFPAAFEYIETLDCSRKLSERAIGLRLTLNKSSLRLNLNAHSPIQKATKRQELHWLEINWCAISKGY
jgi:hypothetical protein